MSKRRDRRKRKQLKKQQTHLSGPVLVDLGTKAFKQGNYDEAIKAWEEARRKDHGAARLPAALAEAYFRRAVLKTTANLNDLEQAVQLQPTDPCYRYHLALSHHRLGQLDQAEPIYRQLLSETPAYDRAAMPLAQLLIDRKRVLNKDPVWDHLSQEVKPQLEAVEAIVRKKAASTLRRLVDDSLEPVWRGLVALATGDRDLARQSLQAALSESESLAALPQGVIHYYLGVLAVADHQAEQALAHWQQAQTHGLNTPHLRKNLAALIYQQVLAKQQAGQPLEALKLLEQVYSFRPVKTTLTDLHRQLNFEAGYEMAGRNNWEQALQHWETARDAGDDSRKLILNLALAYQKAERFYEAAEHWRELLRRRPRKADHPDALNNEQVARLWQNVAENYNKAGFYDEAVKTYKNSVKWAPDNIELRIRLVEALQSDGRWQAAENELHRILEKQPDHIPALLLLAEIYSDDILSNMASDLWQRVLELEPQNPIARQQLAHHYEKRGNFMAQWRDTKGALQIYKEGLSLVPDSQRLHTVIGGTYADQGDFEQARTYFKQALALNPNDLQTLHTIHMVWLEYDSKPDLKQNLERIKSLSGSVPSVFFISLIDRCFEHDQFQQAKELLEYTEARYPDDENTLLDLAMRYAETNQEKHAISLLRQILQDNSDHIEANLRLGSIYYKIGQTRLAHRHWDKAEQQARRENNQMALYHLKTVKNILVHGKAPPQNPLEMLQDMPPELKRQMLEQLPPEIADILQNMDPEMLEMMMNFGFWDDDDYDDEDYYA